MRRIAKFLPALILSIPLTAQAEFVPLLANLSGDAEVPPVSTSADGVASMVLDTTSNDFSWNINFRGLSSPLTVAHFHGPARVGANASPALNLFPPPLGGIFTTNIGADGLSGSFMGMFTLNDDQVADLLSDQWYVNIHSELHGGGELRGQIFRAVVAPIPLPAAVLLLVPAIGLLGFVTRRRATA